MSVLFLFYGAIAGADTLGQQLQIFVDPDFDASGRLSASSTLRYSSDYAYFYVDDIYFNSLGSVLQNSFIEKIKSLAKIFDEQIYQKERDFFGSEPYPGIDNDPKLTILLQKTKNNTGGYINTDHFFEEGGRIQSNRREIIFLNAEVVEEDTHLAASFLAHEFQHVISFQQKENERKINEDVWLNELRSEYAVSLVGLNSPYGESILKRRVQSFIETPSDSLVEWPNEISDYGIAAVFGEYLAEQYGQDLFKETLRYASSGISSLNQFFNSIRTSFQNVFLDWATAVSVNSPDLGPRFYFKNNDFASLRVVPNDVMILSPDGDVSTLKALKPWQPSWISVLATSGSKKSIRLSLNGNGQSSFAGRAIIYLSDGTMSITDFSSLKPIVDISNKNSEIYKLLLIFTNNGKIASFKEIEDYANAIIRLEWIDQKDVVENVVNGSLIKKQGQQELYVVEGKYKRYLSPEIIKLYGHLDPSRAIEIAPEIFDSYITSNYIKNFNDKKVYAAWADNSKHWLNMTGEYFTQSGRDWGAIFMINDLELNYYKNGGDITR